MITLIDESPYDEGYQAYIEGSKQEDNPYPIGSDNAHDWHCGWNDAEEEHWNNIIY